MFTGLVQDIGKIQAVERNTGDLRLVIETALDLDSHAIGASVCCSGCCLTVVEKTQSRFCVDVSQETLSKTTLGSWDIGTLVNLEPSLCLGDELGGHFVFGHVDDVAIIASTKQVGTSLVLEINVKPHLLPYLAVKGSVAVEGVSLTVNALSAEGFSVNIIPHTAQYTTLGQKKPGDQVNIEVDMLARYVARMMEFSKT